MSSLTRVTYRLAACAAALAGMVACSSGRSHPESASPRVRPLSESERVTHVLSRLTFGARSGDAERVVAMGVDRWIDQQLRPETIPDSAMVVALAPIPVWTMDPASTGAAPSFARTVAPLSPMMSPDSAARLAMLAKVRIVLASVGGMNDYFYAGKIIRAQRSERQLLEVMSDFWENHFSVFSGKMPSREAIVVWDRDVLRPRALGKFRDLLGAVAHSPAMLFYLDNHLSTSRGLNENYARELLELHTLGVDGGYTQQDVIEVARALTGWTIKRTAQSSTFSFRPDMHDTGPKVVLGHTLRGGRGQDDGEEVLDLLARHPSTARYISLKLARRLVSDEPPPSLVARAAETFTRTDGDIAEVVRTIVTSREFFSRDAFRAKVKTPFELVVSARRALDARADTTPATARSITQLGQGLFFWPTPEGFPEKGGPWMNSGTIYKRIKFAADMANGRIAGASPIGWRDWSTLERMPFDAQVDGVVKALLGGSAEPATRDAMLSTSTQIDPARSGQILRELLSIAMASPEFQRR